MTKLTKICKGGAPVSEEEGKEKAVRCETFLISVTTCSNFRNMGIKRQVLRKLGPFIDKTKLCNNMKFWIDVFAWSRIFKGHFYKKLWMNVMFEFGSINAEVVKDWLEKTTFWKSWSRLEINVVFEFGSINAVVVKYWFEEKLESGKADQDWEDGIRIRYSDRKRIMPEPADTILFTFFKFIQNYWSFFLKRPKQYCWLFFSFSSWSNCW